MEHNHSPLIYGFLISFFMFGVGIFLAVISSSSTSLEGKLFSLGVGIFVIIGATAMVRGVFKTRDACPICKDKYKYGSRKIE